MAEITGVRSELVARFKREIKEKTYKVKSEEIADKIAQRLKEDAAITESVKQGRWTG
ncbi:MAG: flagellar biosynthesis anti-sigma factor FlgM [Nitrospinae bacterium]|nr:flagellar biosynthesis anti-sigma factor FlgM [Nitrospinota bacterium]